MKSFFTRRKTVQNEEPVLFICYGNNLFCISKDKRDAYSIRRSVVWPGNPRLKRGVISGTATIPCSKKAVDEAFDLLKRYAIVELLENFKQRTFRDLEGPPLDSIRVEWNYGDRQYCFEDLYGSYEQSNDANTHLLMAGLMLKFTELFFLIQQGNI